MALMAMLSSLMTGSPEGLSGSAVSSKSAKNSSKAKPVGKHVRMVEDEIASAEQALVMLNKLKPVMVRLDDHESREGQTRSNLENLEYSMEGMQLNLEALRITATDDEDQAKVRYLEQMYGQLQSRKEAAEELERARKSKEKARKSEGVSDLPEALRGMMMIKALMEAFDELSKEESSESEIDSDSDSDSSSDSDC